MNCQEAPCRPSCFLSAHLSDLHCRSAFSYDALLPSTKAGLCVQAYKGRGEEYKLFWPKQPEFVRMAARFGATIVPFGGVGLDDGFNMLLEPKQIRAIPVLGKLLEDNAKKRIPPARRYFDHPPTCMPCSKPSLLLWCIMPHPSWD